MGDKKKKRREKRKVCEKGRDEKWVNERRESGDKGR